jgi:hypothetical protein
MERREELGRQVDVAAWEWLRPHGERGGLIFVSEGLSLAEVGAALADDDVATVSAWLTDGRVGPPSAEQCADWDRKPALRFSMLVISPYVLIQLYDQQG